ncbi:hypothetical protein [uncultured Croceitalea sp.]|uniref:hypothetical protein n=1 Tax=uncultured Croceitalea sp. TaxID=1798908 RepID=UPI003305D115
MEFIIEISKRKKGFFEFPIISQLIGLAIIIWGLLTICFFVFIVAPFEFIKNKFSKTKVDNNINEVNTLLKTDEYHLVLNFIDDPNPEHQIALDFVYSIVEFHDEMPVFIVKNDGQKTELDNSYITAFEHKINNNLLLQRIRLGENSLPTSDLIEFVTKTGEVIVHKEIGIYELDSFDLKKNKIVGGTIDECIEIEIKASA